MFVKSYSLKVLSLSQQKFFFRLCCSRSSFFGGVGFFHLERLDFRCAAGAGKQFFLAVKLDVGCATAVKNLLVLAVKLDVGCAGALQNCYFRLEKLNFAVLVLIKTAILDWRSLTSLCWF